MTTDLDKLFIHKGAALVTHPTRVRINMKDVRDINFLFTDIHAHEAM